MIVSSFSKNFARLFVLVCAIGIANAQTDTASLTGLVTDPTGSLVTGADVRVTNQSTNITKAATSNGSGQYVVPDLRPGVYSVGVTHPGFKSSKRDGVVLQVGQTARVDVALVIGQTTEVVNVREEARLVESETSDRGIVIDEQKIVELPLNGRDYNQLAQLAPGVLFQTPRLSAQNFKGGFSVNGNRVFMNAFQLDGLDNTSYAESYRGLNIQALQPSVDALQEFKIQTNSYSAEFGRAAGAVVNAIIKSGSNQIHGSAFEFHRDEYLDAANFFANSTNTPKPFHLRNSSAEPSGGPSARTRRSSSATTKDCVTTPAAFRSAAFRRSPGRRECSTSRSSIHTMPKIRAPISCKPRVPVATMERVTAG
jgi:hypothetical protein